MLSGHICLSAPSPERRAVCPGAMRTHPQSSWPPPHDALGRRQGPEWGPGDLVPPALPLSRHPPPQLCKAGPELLGPRLLWPLLQLKLRQRVLVLGTIPRKASWERCGRSAGRLLRWSSHHPGWHSTDGARQATAGLVLVPDDLVPVSSLRGPPFPQVCMEGLDLSAL